MDEEVEFDRWVEAITGDDFRGDTDKALFKQFFIQALRSTKLEGAKIENEACENLSRHLCKTEHPKESNPYICAPCYFGKFIAEEIRSRMKGTDEKAQD